MNEIPDEVKREILRRKIAAYKQEYYSHQVDAQVFRDIGGMDDLLNRAQTNMTNTQKVIDALEEKLAEVPDATQS